MAFVCLGNICRSPMAHVVLDAKVHAAGLADEVVVTSSGTGDWHAGEPMDERAARVLEAHDYDASRHVARQFVIDGYAENDLILAMDASNYADVIDLAPTVADAAKVRMFRTFDPEASPGDLDVPDPWFGGGDGFADVLAIIERSTDALVAELPALAARETA